jgi:hypothetical protein
MEKMPDFLKICLSANRLGFAPILMDYSQDTSWFGIELTQGYYWRDWYHETCNKPEYREQIRTFRSIATKSPLFQCDEDELFDLEAPFSGNGFVALRAAAFFTLPLASFPTRSPWEKNPLQVICFTLDEHGGEQHTSKDIKNWYSFEVFSQDKERLLAEKNASIASGKQLWAERLQLFPVLQFCGNAPAQLYNWSGGDNLIIHIRETLQILNSFTEKWQEGDFPDYAHHLLRDVGLTHKVSGESYSILNNPKKKRLREFWLPSGEKAVFEHHIKLPNGYRIHFYPDIKTKTIYIGYIGVHLPL